MSIDVNKDIAEAVEYAQTHKPNKSNKTKYKKEFKKINKKLDKILCGIKDIKKQQLTKEAEPIRHGNYIEEVTNGGMRRITSCCNDDQTKLTTWYTPKYCPNCGATLGKRKKDE